jgi:hypothetical protein
MKVNHKEEKENEKPKEIILNLFRNDPRVDFNNDFNDAGGDLYRKHGHRLKKENSL